MFRRMPLFFAILGCAILPSLAVAQAAQREPARRQEAPAAAARPANPQSNAQMNAVDMFLARWLIIDNENEIALAKLAEQKAKDSQVKEFAQQMIQDHQQIIDQLARFAGEAGEPRASTAPANNQQPLRDQVRNVNGQNRAEVAREPARAPANQAQPERRVVARPTDQGVIPGQANQQQHPQQGMLALKHELAEECRNSARQELEGKQGKEFDECFIGMQLAGHMMAIDTMKVFERHASDELKQTIAGGLKTAEGHFAKAKKIMQQEAKEESKSEK